MIFFSRIGKSYKVKYDIIWFSQWRPSVTQRLDVFKPITWTWYADSQTINSIPGLYDSIYLINILLCSGWVIKAKKSLLCFCQKGGQKCFQGHLFFISLISWAMMSLGSLAWCSCPLRAAHFHFTALHCIG